MSDKAEADLRAKLIAAARAVRERAFAPYSNFKVGAAIATREGKIFTGCNVESASYGLTVCAERVAVWKAISEGETDFGDLIVVVADTPVLTPPCGICRQVIYEHARHAKVLLTNLTDAYAEYPVAELLPHAFDGSFLGTRWK